MGMAHARRGENRLRRRQGGSLQFDRILDQSQQKCRVFFSRNSNLLQFFQLQPIPLRAIGSKKASLFPFQIG